MASKKAAPAPKADAGSSGVVRLDTRGVPPRAALKAATDNAPAGAAPSTAQASQYTPYKGQDYYKLRDDCLKSKTLFEDPEFPATDRSIYFQTPPSHKIEWKRPKEINKDPHFVVGERNRFDISQGELGDCWLLASVASLSMHEELLNRVVPQDQHLSKDYTGIFHFRFWQYGQWVDVVVDDRLPTYRDQLVYMHSRENNEFWSALFEKAYAKLYGSYESLKGGSSSEAMVDFTGGMTEMIELKGKEPKNLIDIMLKANQRSCLMGCSIEADPNRVEAELPNGLVMGHAYSVTDVRLVPVAVGGTTGKIPLVRCRNPWGNETEWKGAWSDKSREWQAVSEAERKTLGLSFDADGEFWMSMKDFTSNFERLEICHLGPDSLEADQLDGKKKMRFEQIVINGSWIKRVSAGGCRNFIDTFWTNPQYRVTVVDADDDDNENMGTLIVGLLQKDRRKMRKEGADMLTVGYVVYQLKDDEKLPDSPLDINFFKRHASFARCPAFTNTREICGRHRMPPGKYLVVPSTFEPQEEANFLIRLYSEKANKAEECDEKTELKPVEPAKEIAAEATPKIDEAMKKAFAEVAGEDMEIDAYELRDVLNATFKKDFPFDGFSLETARSMVALFDTDQTGKLGLQEFVQLWTDLKKYKAIFKKFDADNSGLLNSIELREVYKHMGITISNRTFQSLVMRYSDKKGQIEFDDFILSAIRLHTVFDTYRAQPKDSQQRACFDLDQFIQLMVYT